MRKVSAETETSIISLLKGGNSERETAARLKISRSVIYRIRKSRDDDLPTQRSGRPRVLSEQLERKYSRLATPGVIETAVDVKKHIEEDYGIAISANTVRRALRKCGLKAKEKVAKPTLTARHARAHQHWTDADWATVIFSDEKKSIALI